MFWILWYPGYTQTDSLYCLPITKARLLVADALRLRFADSLNNSLSQRVDLLDKQSKALSDSYTKLLKIEREKFEKQKEITQGMEGLAMSYRDERDYYQKKYRRQRRGKRALIWVILIEAGRQVIKAVIQ